MNDSRLQIVLTSLVLVLVSASVLADRLALEFLSDAYDSLLALFALGTFVVGAFVLVKALK